MTARGTRDKIAGTQALFNSEVAMAQRFRLLLQVMTVTLPPAAAQSAPITFNFEALGLGATATVTSTVSGLTLTVTRKDGANINVQNLNGVPTVPDFGSRSLSNFLGSSNATASEATLVLNFSAPILSGAISFGDLGGFANDDDDS